MIYFWVDQASSWGIRSYLETRGRPIAERFHVQLYEDLPNCRTLLPQTHIFAALDQLGPNHFNEACEVWDLLASAGECARLLNNPHKVLRRYDLLLRLHEAGINRFRPFRAEDSHLVTRFPVFVRADREHTGNLTSLLCNQRDLKKALRALRVRGYRLRELIVVEFCDTSGSKGFFRKYSAFKVGDRIIPKYLHVSREWMVKSEGTEIDSALAREELEYVEQYYHEARLREIFGITQIDYGRIDYGLLGNSIQVWEINLNPTLGSAPGHKHHSRSDEERALRQKARDLAHARFREALLAIDTSDGRERVEITLSPATLRKLRAEVRRIVHRQALRNWAEKLSGNQYSGAIVRFVSTRLFPRI
jgi:hypothetical protein